MTMTAPVTITAVADFPQHFFLENLAIRRDGSILVSALNRRQLWCVPAPVDTGPVDPALVHTFAPDHLPMGIVETEPDIFYVATLGRATLNRIDLRDWNPGTPAPHIKVLDLDPPVGPNGACLIAPTVILIADTVSGLIWRVDLADGGFTATARVWLRHDTMAPGDDLAPVQLSPSVQIPFPGVNGLQYAAASNFVYYTSSAQQLFMRVAVDPITHDPVGEPERVASGIHALDDFCIDEEAGLAYLTTHIDNTIVRAPLDTDPTRRRNHTVVAGEQFTGDLVGPSSAVWGRDPSDYGRVAYVATDGGETLLPPDGILRPAQVLRIEFGALR